MFTDEIDKDITELGRLHDKGLLTVDECLEILAIVLEG